MCKEFENNRRRLTELAYGNCEYFSADDLIQTFENAENRKPIIAGNETVEQYLKYLASLGMLEKKDDRFRSVA